MASETQRVEAFSDGVFAIAITLLVLELKAPSAGSTPLARLLIRQWPSYVAFLVSFAFIGIMWINHHRLFTHIRRSDDALLVLNLLLLLGVVAVPFPTAVLAASLGQPGERTATLLFSGTYVLIAIAFNILWRYASSSTRRLLGPEVDATAVKQISAQYAFGPLLYAACFVLAWVSVQASLFLNAALACFFAIPPAYLRRRSR
ncbi:MAG TPA: TMEM175 family protein [bacterium]|nr:TMEM175 family protein [bacterium]